MNGPCMIPRVGISKHELTIHGFILYILSEKSSYNNNNNNKFEQFLPS